eukprot:EG_transcript_3806
MADTSGRFVAPKYQDLPWAAVWLVQLAGTIAASIFAVIRSPSVRIGSKSTGVGAAIQWVAVGVAVSVGNAVLVLFLVRKFPKQFIYICNILYICMMFGLAVLSFLLGGIFYGILLLLVALAYTWWFKSVRGRIPFSALMLQMGTGICAKFPAMTLLAFLGFVVVALYSIMFLFLVAFCQSIPGLWILLVFLYYWTGEAFHNVLYTTCCGVAASWYFLRGRVTNPTVGAFRRSVTTSLGSVCLGSLLVALLKTARLCLRMCMDQLTQEGGCGVVACFFLCCVEWMLSMIEGMLEWFNEYAYSQIAIYGKKYTEAAKDTLALLSRAGLVAVVNDLLINPVFLMTGLFSGILVGLVVGFLAGDGVFGVFGFLIGVYMCTLVLGTVRACIVTVFVCFAEDPAVLRENDPALCSALDAASAGQLTAVAAAADTAPTSPPPPAAPACAAASCPDVPYGIPVGPPPPAYGQPVRPSSLPCQPSEPPPPYAPHPSSFASHPPPQYGQPGYAQAPPPVAPWAAPLPPQATGGYPPAKPMDNGGYQYHPPAKSSSSDAPPPAEAPPAAAPSRPPEIVAGANGPLLVGLRVRVQQRHILEGGPGTSEGSGDTWHEGIVELVQPQVGLVGIKFDAGKGGMAQGQHTHMM